MGAWHLAHKNGKGGYPVHLGKGNQKESAIPEYKATRGPQVLVLGSIYQGPIVVIFLTHSHTCPLCFCRFVRRIDRQYMYELRCERATVLYAMALQPTKRGWAKESQRQGSLKKEKLNWYGSKLNRQKSHRF